MAKASPNLHELLVFENEHYLIVNKPPFLASLDERDTSRSSLLRLVQSDYPDAQLCHRLDKETSGALAIAKHPKAYRHLSGQFAKRKVEKVYHAIVDGLHKYQERIVTFPIAVSNRRNVRIDSIEGKPSETVFSTLQHFRQHTLLECRPLTGRMHQIRIHLAAIKSPICADIMYGGRFTHLSELKKNFKLKKGTEELPLIQRVALHARGLRFENLDGNEVHVEAEYPKDIRSFLNQLERFS